MKKNAAINIHKDYVVVPICKISENIFLVFKTSFASVITRELGLNDNSSTDTHSEISNLSVNDIINDIVINL